MRKCNPDVYDNVYLLIKILIILGSIIKTYNKEQEHKIQYKKRGDIKESNNKESNNTEKIKHEKKEKGIKSITKEENNKKIKSKEDKVNLEKKSNINKVLTNIPIVISRKKVSIPIEEIVDLKEEALEVKSISNRVFLKEAVFVPVKNDKRNIKTRKGKLFLKGFVRNCIEYLSFEYCDDKRIKGGIKYCINYIPFKCSTLMECMVLPKIYSKDEFKNTILRIPDTRKGKENTYTYKYEEKINCEITEIKILGTRECKNRKPLNDTFFLEKTFSKVEEKMMIELSLLLTEKNNVVMVR